MGELTRATVLDRARDCVTRDRAATHGRPEDIFAEVAAHWSIDLGILLDGIDVARMMAQLKLVRAKNNPGHADNWIDIAGYAAIGGELGAPEPAEAPPEECVGEACVLAVEPRIDARGWPYATVRVAVREQDRAIGSVAEPGPQKDSGPAVAEAPPEPGAGGRCAREETPVVEIAREVSDVVVPAEAPGMESSVELGAASAEGSGAAAEELTASAAAPREKAARLAPEDWAPLVARVLAGEREKDVAAEAGVSSAQLRGKIMAARNRAKRDAVEGAAAEPEPEPIEEAPAEEPAPSPEAVACEAEVAGVNSSTENAPVPGENDDRRTSSVNSALNSSTPPITASAPIPRDAPLDPAAYAQARQGAWLDDGGWTNAEDEIVLTGIISGVGSYETSQRLTGRKPADVVRRYKQLVPQPGVVAQTEALKRVRARLAAERGRAAE